MRFILYGDFDSVDIVAVDIPADVVLRLLLFIIEKLLTTLS